VNESLIFGVSETYLTFAILPEYFLYYIFVWFGSWISPKFWR